MTYLKARLQKLEAQAAPPLYTGFLRIIVDGKPTPEQERQIAAAEAAGMFVIVRVIVSPKRLSV